MDYLKSVFVAFAAAIKVIYGGFKIRQRLPGLPAAIINYGHAHVSFFENFGHDQLFTRVYLIVIEIKRNIIMFIAWSKQQLQTET